MYILVDENNKMGYKRKRVTNENLNSYPEWLLKIWEKAKLIKKKGEAKKAPEVKKENKS